MQSNYNDCLTRLLKDEGGYSNDPADKGGPTNYGITIADYRTYINKSGTAQDVKNMTVAQAAKIYKAHYWDALGCDNLPSGVDYTVFDYGVNSGLARPKADLVKFKDKSGVTLINAINDERQAFLNRIGVGKKSKFLKGWTARVARVRAHSLELSKQNPTPAGTGASAGAAGAVIAGGTAMAATPHYYWPFIIGGIAFVFAVGGIAYLIHSYKETK